MSVTDLTQVSTTPTVDGVSFSYLPIVSGVLIYLLGQFIMKFVFEPTCEFRKVIQKASNVVLREQHKITNFDLSCELSSELKQLAGELRSSQDVIVFYFLMRLFSLFKLPSKKGVFKAAQALNYLSNAHIDNNSEHVIHYRDEIHQYLKVATSYEGNQFKNFWTTLLTVVRRRIKL